MQRDNLEKAFEEFLEREEYDQAQGAIFVLVRAAFLAGWKARENHPPAEIIPLHIHRQKEEQA